LKVISDVAKHEKTIKKSIKKYGYFAEHNYTHYFYNQNKWNENLFFDFGNDKILLMQFEKENNIWSLFPNSILAPEAERLELLMEAANYILKKRNGKKFIVEVSEDLKKKILNRFKLKNSFRACSSDILYWPVYNMDLWDLKLRGNKWKKLRNVKNRFYKRNKIRVINSKNVPKEELKKILSSWLKKRDARDIVEKRIFFKFN